MPERTCSIDGCEKRVSARGWCPMHYSRWKKHGDPLVVRHKHDANRVDSNQRKLCRQCGDPFGPSPRCAHSQWVRRQFCGALCANRWRAHHTPSAGANFRSRADHGAKVREGMRRSPAMQQRAMRRRRKNKHVAAHAKLERAARGQGSVRRWSSGPCLLCRQSFTTTNALTRYCSDACQKQANRVRAKLNGKSSHRSRARRYGVEYQPVDRLAIFERDQHQCQICGCPGEPDFWVDGEYNPWAATLDHVIPMSAGGGHTEANLQTACALCNSIKSDCVEGTTGRQIRAGVG